MTATPVELLLSKLPDATTKGKGWSARCPAHEDRRPSLSVSEGDDGRALVWCHAGCTVEAICNAVGLRVADLMTDDTSTMSTSTQPRQTREKSQYCRQQNGKGATTYETAKAAIEALERKHGKRSALWTYRDAQGDPAGVIVRWDTAEGKDIRPVARRGERWTIGGMPEPRPLYGLLELAGADRVIIVEGEKAAEAAQSIGLIATTSPHGSKSASKVDWSPLAGKDCVILPDHDEAGRAYANDVVAILSQLTPAPKVRVVELEKLPGGSPMPKGGDLVDWIDAHGDAAEPETIADNLNTLVDAAEVEIAEPRTACNECFQPFPSDTLPEPVRGFVVAAAKAIGCDPSYIALPLLACLARAIGNKRVIRLKRSWTEPAVIWAAIIGKSGTQKTPALQAATGSLLKRQTEAMAGNAEKEKDYEQAMAEYKKEMSFWRNKKTTENAPWEPERPKCERFVASDITIEALASLLDGQLDGVLVARDELSGWINGIAEYKGGKGSDCGHWLACWSAQPLIVDRKTGDKKTISIDRASVSLCGGIQPGILATAIGREHMQDGLCARLLFAMPPARVITWTDATIDVETELALSQVFNNLFENLEPALDENEEPAPYPLDLSPKAKAVWIEYYNRHRCEMIELEDDLAAAWSKLEAYTARFALIFQLCKWAAGDATAGSAIDEYSMRAAIALSDWFGNEAKRVYRLFGENDEECDRREMVDWITRKGGSVSAREVQQGHRQYRTSAEAEAALDELARAGYGGWEDVPPGPKGGRPSRVFRLSTLSTSTQPARTRDSEGFVDVDTVDAPETQPDGDWGEL